jgi:glutathione synthase/RimK-type ligase-like ATP-grasp enzyme
VAAAGSKSINIVLATCGEWPDLSVSDAELARELTDRGHRVTARPWNTAPLSEFTSADMVVLRSNWDYHHDLARFDQWLGEVDDSPAVLHNPAHLVRAYLNKSSLVDLSDAGFVTPRTLATPEFDADAAVDWADRHGFDRVVIKPSVGASGFGVELVACHDLAAAAERWRQDPDRRPLLIQEFMPQVQGGEHALVFFGGRFSHALLRTAADGDFRVNGAYGGSMSLLKNPSQALIEFGHKVEAALPGPATYVRIDVVGDESGFAIMEVEVNEPALGLHLAPGSAARFADALIRCPDAGLP